jgi:osmotically-inducible protein OsmY
MSIRITSLGLPAALVAASLLAACENTARGIEQDTENNRAKAKAAAEAAAPKIEQATAEAKQAVANAAGNAANTTANALDGATRTMQVKMALVADKSLDASEIHVETDQTARTVTLKGHVPTSAQKAEAERIARAKAPDYKVVNTLVVQD